MDKKPTYEELEQQYNKLLAEKEAKLSHLLKNSFDMVVLLDSEGNQTYVSESCEKILGYSPDELTNIPVIEKMIHPEDQEKTYNGLKGILTKKAHGGTQYRHRHKNGGWIYLEAFGTNQLDNPNINSIVLNVRDVTERKNAELALVESQARLRELNATKDRFFSIIAHDLKSPFANVLGLSEMLEEHAQNKDYGELEQISKLIHQSSLLAMDLLTNLLEWARAQTGRIKFNPVKVNLKEQVNEVKNLLTNLALQKSITIHNNLENNTFVQADKKMLSTIFRNLISNGIKFTHQGGKITVNATQLDHQIIVSVADNGIGMNPELTDNLFKIDYSYSSPGTHQETGTGLGLLLCKEFVDFHNGKIWAVSTPGKGSTFHFTLSADSQNS
ncbi:MAG TPA: PAS domain-containing sensor histidine kinase [Prolixibacteraceae bacterium]|nr:PAS domain-containing sensor histidine kinase [Prolixibacteraceae bacterium]